MRPVEPANHVKNRAPLAHLEAGQYKNSLVSNGLVKRLLPTTNQKKKTGRKKNPPQKKTWIFCTPGLSTRPGLLATPMRANKLAISSLILILSIGMAAREPAVVDRPNPARTRLIVEGTAKSPHGLGTKHGPNHPGVASRVGLFKVQQPYHRNTPLHPV